MENIEESAVFRSEKLLFTTGTLEFGLEERSVMIDHHRRELIYICRQLKSFKKDIEHIIISRMPLSMVSNLAYNLVHNLVSCYIGLTIYEYLTTAYLLSENYNDNYRLWKIYTKFAKEVEELIANLEEENVFYIGEESAVENLMPSSNSQNHAVRSLLNLEHMLSKINGEGLFHAIIHYLRAIGNRLERIKNGLNELTDDDFDTIYTANYNFYKQEYWPSEVTQFRHHIEANYFRRDHDKIEVLERKLWDDKCQFEQDGTGRLWRDFFDDKKTLYFEMRRADINEEQWKYFFKNICRFEEYEKWIDELRYPQETDVDKQKRERLLRSNSVFNLKPARSKYVVDILLLYKFIETRFISKTMFVYEWYALYHILRRVGVITTCTVEDFVKQMNDEEWFSHVEKKSSANEINTYHFLDNISPDVWVDKDIPGGSNATKKALKNLYRKYSDLEDTIDEIYIK